MSDPELAPLALADGELLWSAQFLPAPIADAALLALQKQIVWERHHLRIFGRQTPAPRLSCWIGDPVAAYSYSRLRFEPRPWPDCLIPLRGPVADASGERFNGVLANRYANGSEYMGWHADNEPELGPRPVIASLSLGATRRFVLRHRQTRARVELALGHGSLLVMRGDTQRNWQHSLPRTAKSVGLRINLTFRRILVATAPAEPGLAGQR